MSAQQLIDRLEKQGLLEAKVIARLRQQVAAKAGVSPQAVLKTLMDRGLLTKFQAKKLLDDVKSSSQSASPPPESEELTLVQDDDSPRPDQADDDLGLAMLDDDRADDTDDEGADDMVMLEPVSRRSADQIPDESLEPLGGGDGGLEPLGGEAVAADPLSGDLGADALGGEPTATAAAPPKTRLGSGGRGGYKPPKKNKFKTSVWDSKFLLIGGGGLALLCVALVVLLISLTRGTAAEFIEKADQSYRDASYTQAMKDYDDFLRRFPNDPNASKARVKKSMARLWQAVDGGSRDMSDALKVAHSVIGEVRDEEYFPEARPEVASLLPRIALGLSEQASGAADRAAALDAIGKAEEAMELVNDPTLIPTSQRASIESRVSEVTANLKDATRSVEMSDRLTADIQRINDSLSRGETADAYQIRKELLAVYPRLATNEKLEEAVRSITERERELVRVTENAVSPLADERATDPRQRIVLADRTGESGVAGVENHVLLVLAKGSVYALDAATGGFKWRRFVGHDTTFQPVALSKQIGADALMVDGRFNELLRVAADDGRLKWRLEIGEPFNDPVLVGDKIFVALRSGRLWEVDAESGACDRQVEFPMRLTVPPAFDDKRPTLFQVGEHSNLYVISRDTLKCEEVYYLGHKVGSVVAHPAVSVGHLFVPENSGDSNAMLHVLKMDGNGLNLAEAMKTEWLKGHVVVPPVLYGRRVIVLTDLGAIRVYDVEPANADNPVTLAVQPLVATFPEPAVGFPLVDAGHVWVACRSLTSYEIQFAHNNLVRKWIGFDNDRFVAPPQVIGSLLVSARKRGDAAGVSVAAVDAATREPKWQTDLAVPPVLITSGADGDGLVAISSNAALYKLGPPQLNAGFQDRRETVPSNVVSGLTGAVSFGNGRWALYSDTQRDRLMVYDPNRRSVLGSMTLPGNASATSRPVTFNEGLLVPMDNGQVLLLGSSLGTVLPFQPRVDAGSAVDWRRPAVTDDGQEFFISAGIRMYRIGVKSDPQPHLAENAFVELGREISSPLAVVGNSLYAVTGSAEGDTLEAFEVPSMAAGEKWELEGRVTFGPERVGDVVLVATDKEGLLCMSAGHQRRWVSPLPHGPLAGVPRWVDDRLVLTSKNGTVWQLDAASGQETGSVEIGQPLGAGPVVVESKIFFPNQQGQSLLVPGSDGVLHLVENLNEAG